MKRTAGALLLAGLTATAGISQVGAAPTDAETAEHDRLHEAAGTAAASPAGAVERVAAVFRAGYRTPMDVVSDPRFAPVMADPEARQALRTLVREHARETEAVIAAEEEPGDRLKIAGRITDENTGLPVAGALVELVHADAEGLYAPDAGAWNPRLYAYLMTDADGTFRADTIRPGSYRNSGGGTVPQHVHFSVSADGYRDYNSEFLLSDDPLAEPERGHALIADVEGDAAGRTARITIPLQPE